MYESGFPNLRDYRGSGCSNRGQPRPTYCAMPEFGWEPVTRSALSITLMLVNAH
jgi:hypothetical protein